MAKTKKSSDTDANQLSLFDLVRQTREERTRSDPQVGTLNITLQLQEVIDKAIGQCPLSRDLIAGRMSELSGMTVTRFMLDSWTSSAKHKHRFPAELLPAFCKATGNIDAANFLARKCGILTLPDKDVLLADMGRKIEIREEANRDIRRIKFYLREIEQ